MRIEIILARRAVQLVPVRLKIRIAVGEVEQGEGHFDEAEQLRAIERGEDAIDWRRFPPEECCGRVHCADSRSRWNATASG